MDELRSIVIVFRLKLRKDTGRDLLPLMTGSSLRLAGD